MSDSLKQENLRNLMQHIHSEDDLNYFIQDVLPRISSFDKQIKKSIIDAEVVDIKSVPRRGRPPKHALATVVDIPTDHDSEEKIDEIMPRKYQTIDDALEEQITSLYAKGLTTGDIQNYLKEMHQIEISHDEISVITNKVLPLMREWQSRPLSPLYPIIFLDGLVFKVRDGGKIVNKCAYVVLGITDAGHKEILGLWIGETEGAKFWMQVLTEMKNRGVEDLLICCIDGLPGFPDAIKAVFPNALIQQCIVHQVRNTMKFITHRYRKDFFESLRKIYSAPSEEAALHALEEAKEKWPQYSMQLKTWETKWPVLSSFFQFPPELRKLIYTTNMIENLNMLFRKVTKTSKMFPHDEALLKLLWLAQYDISSKWRSAVHSWGEIITQLSILFPDKILL